MDCLDLVANSNRRNHETCKCYRSKSRNSVFMTKIQYVKNWLQLSIFWSPLKLTIRRRAQWELNGSALFFRLMQSRLLMNVGMTDLVLCYLFSIRNESVFPRISACIIQGFLSTPFDWISDVFTYLSRRKRARRTAYADTNASIGYLGQHDRWWPRCQSHSFYSR